MITFFTKNSLISQQQPGFKPSDSCTNQLQSIMYQIYESFDDVHEIRSVFLHMSKAFISYGMSTAQKMKFSIEDFFSKCDQIRRNLRVESHLLKKSLVENFIFCAVKGLILKLEQNGISGNVLKLLRQLAWRKLLWRRNDLDWKTCLISMFSKNFSPSEHLLAALSRNSLPLTSWNLENKEWY